MVDNYYEIEVKFVPVDHCIELLKPDGTMDNRCDGCLFYEKTIIFVELKDKGILKEQTGLRTPRNNSGIQSSVLRMKGNRMSLPLRRHI